MTNRKPERTPGQAATQQPAAQTITIPLAEYIALTRSAALLDIILHDHTPYHDAVDIVKNVLIDQQRAEAGAAQ